MSVKQGLKALIRKSFGKIKQVVSLPDLIEIQSKSFNDFIQFDYLPSERKYMGLERVLKDIFPIEYNDRIALEYVSYELGEWACVCGSLTGIENRYRWIDPKTKKEGVGRIPKDDAGGRRYVVCKRCSSRVNIKVPYTVDEARYSGKTYSLPLKVRMQLTSWEVNEETSERTLRDIKEQEVFFCDLPVMVDLHENADGEVLLGSQGTFLINGVDRVVVSQIHRAPGVVFSLSKKMRDFRGYPYHVARLIPARGSWLDFEFDTSDLLYVRIDKKKKILATTFLQAIGYSREEILPLFYKFDTVRVSKKGFSYKINNELVGKRIEADSLPEKHAAAFSVGKRITEKVVADLKDAGVTSFAIRSASLVNRYVADDIVDETTGELIASQGSALTVDLLESLCDSGIKSFRIVRSSGYIVPPFMALTLAQDTAVSYEDALREVYYKLRPGDIPSLEIMEEYIQNMFFNSRFYDMTIVGRIRTNRKLGINIDHDTTHLTKEEIIATINYIVGLRERGEGEVDDIDHLGNRCVRLVGELMENQMYVGFARVEKIARERFRLQENAASLMPYDFLNVKPMAAVMREFFGTGQLSQFMDQTNPLAEMAHKRRISALGPGGVTRERATFEVRDVHTSHYGRICPIETPEGQNVGLISSLSTYARVNELGFIETAYRPVKKGKVTDEIEFLDAYQEIGKSIAQSTTAVDTKGKIANDKTQVRCDGNIVNIESDGVDYVDASPRQMVSVATALIPFLEHDDANRALMGSNMQRQAVPLVKCQAPLVGTGMEKEVVSGQGAVLTARHAGTVEYVSADKIVVKLDQTGNDERWFARPVDIYHLKKFGRSSHNTWVHHTPIVSVGERVEFGDPLTNGPSTQKGNLALGSNVVIAFMPWHGYNFEDAIVCSRRLVSDDVFTSVHVEEFVVEARDTKLGAEEITKDIPNVSEKDLEALDDDGIIQVGSRIKPGDILVGKVTLKGDVQVSPEEKLLRAIFGEKSREVRDTSLRVRPGVRGTVVDVKVFSRSGIRKDKRYKEIVAKETAKIEVNFSHHLEILHNAIAEKAMKLLAGLDPKKYTKKYCQGLDLQDLLSTKVADKDIVERLKRFAEVLKSQEQVLTALKEERIAKLRKGDDLPSGVIKMVRVYVAMKRPLSVGDKMAGRHGNKGIVSCSVNPEDMPYMEDGTPVDIVLNPLGVPGRMNVGQILETLLGMAGKKIGAKFARELNEMTYKQTKEQLSEFYGKDVIASIEKTDGEEGIRGLAEHVAKHDFAMETPVFDGADYSKEISPLLEKTGLSSNGTCRLYDGLSGEPFGQNVTVGCMYMMKLNHLADDKLHARSVGPYSLITQQPLGGKAQFGGQRLGEMEVWALYAHGASFILQEMLTIKSDDVNGRVKAYESIVRGDEVPEPGIPESFNVLVKELQSLGLQIDLFKTNKEQVGE